MAMIELKDIRKTYTLPDGAKVQAVNGVSLEIEQRRHLRHHRFLGRRQVDARALHQPARAARRGSVHRRGQLTPGALARGAARNMRRKIGMIFQHFSLSPAHGRGQHRTRAAARTLTSDAIAKKRDRLAPRARRLSDHVNKATPRSSRAARSSASPLRAPSPTTRRSCSATRQRAPSTRKATKTTLETAEAHQREARHHHGCDHAPDGSREADLLARVVMEHGPHRRRGQRRRRFSWPPEGAHHEERFIDTARPVDMPPSGTTSRTCAELGKEANGSSVHLLTCVHRQRDEPAPDFGDATSRFNMDGEHPLRQRRLRAGTTDRLAHVLISPIAGPYHNVVTFLNTSAVVVTTEISDAPVHAFFAPIERLWPDFSPASSNASSCSHGRNHRRVLGIITGVLLVTSRTRSRSSPLDLHASRTAIVIIRSIPFIILLVAPHPAHALHRRHGLDRHGLVRRARLRSLWRLLRAPSIEQVLCRSRPRPHRGKPSQWALTPFEIITDVYLQEAMPASSRPHDDHVR
jgi:hypothetical protein